MSRKLRVGIVGTGFGMRVLLPAFRSQRGCEVAAVCASRLVHAKKAAHLYRIPKAYGDWRKMAGDPSLDALAIAVPADLQPSISRAALRAKKALFCEKPIAATLREARALADSARKARVATAVDFEFAEAPALREAKKLLSQKKLGRIRHAALSWQVESYSSRSKRRSWKHEAEKGGGALRLFASHAFHYLEWLLGPVDAVNARLRKAEGIPGSADTLCMMRMRFAPGFYANLTVSTHAVHGSGHRLEIYGDKGALRLENRPSEDINDFRLYLGLRGDKQMKLVRLSRASSNRKDDRIGAVSSLVRRFVDAASRGRRLRPNIQDGFRVQQLIDAAARSDAMAGKAVFL